jgi:hypothetical protein
MDLYVSSREVPKTARNKRIYPGGGGASTAAGSSGATAAPLGNGWTIETDANGLRFLKDTVLKGRLKNDGTMQYVGDVEAFSTFA